MEVLTTQHIIACMVIMAFAGMVQALCGFGFGLVSIAVMALFLPDVKVATILPVLPNLILCVYMLWQMFRYIPWRRMAWNYPASVVGAPLGVLFLSWAPIWTVWLGLGLVLILGGSYAWFPVVGKWRWHPIWTGIPCGLAGGAISGAFGSGGPPTVAYMSNQHLSHEEYMAGLQAVFVSTALMRVLSLSGLGMMSPRLAVVSAGGIVVALIGCAIGLAIVPRVSRQTLRRYVQISQVVLGVFYLVKVVGMTHILPSRYAFGNSTISLAGLSMHSRHIAIEERTMPDMIPVYRLKKYAKLPELSARIDQAPWIDLPEFGPLYLLGTEGMPAPAKTVVKACWTDTSIRILWYCQDDAVRAVYTNRDDPLWSEEVVELFVCPGRNLTDYYEFNFNPLGAVFDARIANPSIIRDETFKPDIPWNCEGLRWKVIGEGKFNGTADQDKWWAVEADIPFASLGGAKTPSHGEYWHANVYRIERTEPVQYASWSVLPVFKPGFHQADRFGSWVFVE